MKIISDMVIRIRKIGPTLTLCLEANYKGDKKSLEKNSLKQLMILMLLMLMPIPIVARTRF